MDAPIVSASEARVETPLARRFLVQLCKHFEHRLAVSYDDTQGRIPFAMGTCLLRTEPGVLILRAEAADAAQRAQVEDVTARHLLRFAFRDPPEIVWLPVEG